VNTFATQDWNKFKQTVRKYDGKGLFDGYLHDVWVPIIKQTEFREKMLAKHLTQSPTS